MFEKARLRLTAWYLLIIMGISILFSVSFYNATTREVQRIVVRMKTEAQDPFDNLQVSPRIIQMRMQDLEEARQRLLYALIFLNGVILIVAGSGGYFLAGRTLKPIQEMVEEQNRFITDASHELRTPLTATRTAMEVALRDKSLTPKDARKVLESGLEDIISIQSLSDDLLRLSQSGNTTSTPIFTTVILTQVIAAAIKKVEILAKAKGITIVNKSANAKVKGNEYSLEELFVIFLDNAIKYSPHKSTITISMQKPDGHIAVVIADNGVGISEKDIKHIFDRFYRVEKSRTKNKISGYGLGLSIAQKIVMEHKGHIKVASVVGKGTTFTILLPAVK